MTVLVIGAVSREAPGGGAVICSVTIQPWLAPASKLCSAASGHRPADDRLQRGRP
jgi:hypothetical protein